VFVVVSLSLEVSPSPDKLALPLSSTLAVVASPGPDSHGRGGAVAFSVLIGPRGSAERYGEREHARCGEKYRVYIHPPGFRRAGVPVFRDQVCQRGKERMKVQQRARKKNC